MKINVTVDLEDFYNEDETSFNEQILDYISSQVKSKIFDQFKDKGFDLVAQNVKKLTDSVFDNQIQLMIEDVFKNRVSKNGTTWEKIISEKLENRNYFREDSDLEKYLQDNIRRSDSAIHEIIAGHCNKISKDLKDRYDLMFASQIVIKLNEQGLLKSDLSTLLTNDKQ
jgi:hypothetical protein